MNNTLTSRPEWVKKIAEEEHGRHYRGRVADGEFYKYYPPGSVSSNVHRAFSRSGSRQGNTARNNAYYHGDLSLLKQRAEENGYSTSDDDVSLSLKAGTSLHQSIERGDPYGVSICDLIAAKRANLIEQPEPPTIELHKLVPLYELFEDTKKHYLPSCTVAGVTFR